MSDNDHLPLDRLPDAPCLLPTETTVARGYIDDTGDDAIVVALLDPTVGPVNIAYTPEEAYQLGARLMVECSKLDLMTPHPDTEEQSK